MINRFRVNCNVNVVKKSCNVFSDASSRPGESGLSLVNFMLPENYSQLNNHMAITVLGCKLSLTNFFAGDSCVSCATISIFCKSLPGFVD